MARKIFLPTASALVEKTLLATTSMYAWMRDITAGVTAGGGPAPSDATYVVKTADASLPNALVATNSSTVTLDYSVAGQVAWNATASSRQFWQYRAKTTATSGYPGNGYILWDNATQISATHLLFSHLTDDDLDIDIFLSFLATGQDIILQDADASANVQKWTISGAPTNTNPGTPTSYWTIPVTFVSSAGTGTTGFANNHQIVAVIFAGTGPGSGNVTTSVTLTNNNLVVGNGGMDIKVAAATDGQVPIGKSSDGSVTLANLTAGSGITITNGAASITIAASGSSGSGATLIGLTRLTGDGAATAFDLADVAEYVFNVTDAGLTSDPVADYSVSSDGTQVIFGSAPTAGHVLTFQYVVAQA